jgi:hypothetical protein
MDVSFLRLFIGNSWRGGIICPIEASNGLILGLSALDADGSRQEDNSGIAIISTNPMVAPVIALMLNEFNAHTVGQKTKRGGERG